MRVTEWTNDFRLRGASAVKLSSAQITAALHGIKAPVLLLLGEEGHGQYNLMAEQAERGNRQCSGRGNQG